MRVFKLCASLGPAATVTPYKMGMSRSDVRRSRRKAQALAYIVALTKKELRQQQQQKRTTSTKLYSSTRSTLEYSRLLPQDLVLHPSDEIAANRSSRGCVCLISHSAYQVINRSTDGRGSRRGDGFSDSVDSVYSSRLGLLESTRLLDDSRRVDSQDFNGSTHQ